MKDEIVGNSHGDSRDVACMYCACAEWSGEGRERVIGFKLGCEETCEDNSISI